MTLETHTIKELIENIEKTKKNGLIEKSIFQINSFTEMKDVRQYLKANDYEYYFIHSPHYMAFPMVLHINFKPIL